MKNSKKIQNDEIDLSKLLIMLWKNKAKIALITIFSFSVAELTISSSLIIAKILVSRLR